MHAGWPLDTANSPDRDPVDLDDAAVPGAGDDDDGEGPDGGEQPTGTKSAKKATKKKAVKKKKAKKAASAAGRAAAKAKAAKKSAAKAKPKAKQTKARGARPGDEDYDYDKYDDAPERISLDDDDYEDGEEGEDNAGSNGKATRKKKAAKKKTKKKAAGRKGKSSIAKIAAGKELVIVESPAKAKTINKFLGSDYLVKSSVGHIRDLPRSKLGIEMSEVTLDDDTLVRGEVLDYPAAIDLESYDGDVVRLAVSDPKPIKDRYKQRWGGVIDIPREDIKTIEPVLTGRYIDIREKKEVIKELREAASVAKAVWLASDQDREGEAIAWHIKETLGLDEKRTHRVVFNEITKKAIQAAFATPGALDMDKVMAQEARRFLDRLMGYKLSPLVQKSVRRKTSAGRVQSVALRMISEREREIAAFTSHVYWTVEADVRKAEGAEAERSPFRVDLKHWRALPDEFPLPVDHDADATADEIGRAEAAARKKIADAVKADADNGATDGRYDRLLDPARDLRDNEKVKAMVRALEAATWRIDAVTKQQKTDRARPPLITSTLQATASNRLGFAARRTMGLAQALYEGVDVPGEGPTGLITYMRTDSVRMSDDALAEVRNLIERDYGAKYVPGKPNAYKSRSGAQEAHECIRPTSFERTPALMRRALDPNPSDQSKQAKDRRDQLKLYDLIWTHAVASQMAPCVVNMTHVDVGTYTTENAAERLLGRLRCHGREIVFDGYTRLLPKAVDKKAQTLPPLTDNDLLDLLKLMQSEHTTQPPPRYSEATLVKALEKNGIGRPSTYAAILTKIRDREYVELRERKFHATELGLEVNDLLVEHFPHEIAVDFTANVEKQLDKVEAANLQMEDVVRNFYAKLIEDLQTAEDKIGTMKNETTDEKCPECDAPMVVRFSRMGKFLGCSRYPECKGIKNLASDGTTTKATMGESPYVCDLCDSPMSYRMSRRGRFLGCTAYPNCKNTYNVNADGKAQSEEILVDACEKCGSNMRVRFGKRGKFCGCTNFPTCRGTMPYPKDISQYKVRLRKPNLAEGASEPESSPPPEEAEPAHSTTGGGETDDEVPF